MEVPGAVDASFDCNFERLAHGDASVQGAESEPEVEK
jgi:hypothetical protein